MISSALGVKLWSRGKGPCWQVLEESCRAEVGITLMCSVCTVNVNAG